MAKPMPAAEVDVSADLVRRLLADQHPDLASLPVSFLASGWDNAMYRLGPRSLGGDRHRYTDSGSFRRSHSSVHSDRISSERVTRAI